MGRLTGVVGLALLALVIGLQGCSGGGDDDDDDAATGTGGAGGSSGTSICDTNCDFDPGLDCTGEPTRDECMTGCNYIVSSCASEFGELVNCFIDEPSSSFECTSDGAELKHDEVCTTEYNAVDSCLFGGGGAGNSDMFVCDGGMTEVSMNGVCDGVEDCDDGSDEAGC